MAAGNRKERRAAAKESAKTTGSSFQPTNEIDQAGVDYILQHPDRSGPKGKTLFDLAEERQRELDIQNGRIRPSASDEDGEPIGPLGDAMLYSISLAMFHLTFDVLVYKQYWEDIVVLEILQRAAMAVPIFFFLVYITHVDLSMRFPTVRNLVFLAGSVAAGSYLIHSINRNAYFYVMKAAPPVGCLWIWKIGRAHV